MFNWLKRLHGDGEVRVEGEMVDGRKFTATAPFMGYIESEQELINDTINLMLVKYGSVKKIRITAISGCGNPDLQLSGKYYIAKPKVRKS